MHRIFDHATFGRFISIYAFVLLLIATGEAVVTSHLSHALVDWTSTDTLKSLLLNIASYLITAQVGILGVVSIAIGLVTIFAERENASTNVQVYYHESLAFGIVASSIALLAVLCVQLLWPVQFTLHWFGYGTAGQLFKLTLTTFHLAWLILNLSGMAHFVATTLAFVQQTARERLRERYTTNVVLPVEMRKRLRNQLYLAAGPELVQEFAPTVGKRWNKPTVYLGVDFGGIGEVEIPLPVGKRLALNDARMAWIRWAVSRWLKRCQLAEPDRSNKSSGLRTEPFLVFPPRLDESASVQAGLCRRRDGLPLDRWERLALRWAFRFKGGL